jgi:hypothetical protein
VTVEFEATTGLQRRAITPEMAAAVRQANVRVIESIRRECTDYLIVLNEEHLRRIPAKFSTYYNGSRPNVSLGKDAPTGARSSASGTSLHIQS